MNEHPNRRASDLNTTDIVALALALPSAAGVIYALASMNFTVMWIANGVLACATFFKVRSSRAKFVRSHRADESETRDRRTGEAAHA
jgi:hypothetical protein